MTPTDIHHRQVRAILVPLDGSDLAEQALRVATARAQRAGAELHLVSVHQPVPVSSLPAEIAVPVQQLDTDALDNLRRYLSGVAAAMQTTLRTRVVTAALRGDVATELCRYVEDNDVDLVVMTTHGRTGLSRLWLGSVADRLLRRLAIPVLLLHPGDEARAADHRHMVVALDGDIEEPILDAMVVVGAKPGVTRCLLVRVVEPTVPVWSGLAAYPGHLPTDLTARQVDDAWQYLGRIADRLEKAGWEAEPEVLVGRGVANQVLALAEACGADCIVVGTHGTRGLERLLIGSVADKIVRGARVPVLVAPVGHTETALLTNGRAAAPATA